MCATCERVQAPLWRRRVQAVPVQWVMKLGQFGIGEAKIRTDAEHAIVARAREVTKQRQQRTLVETAPEADHQAIRGVERYHRALQDQARALKLQVEVDFNVKLNVAVAAAKWLVRHAAWIQHRFAISSELKTTAFSEFATRTMLGRS